MFNRFQGILPPCFYRILFNCEAFISEINLALYVLSFFLEGYVTAVCLVLGLTYHGLSFCCLLTWNGS